MYESDNPVPAEAPDVPPVKQGMSKVLLVSLIVNAVLVVGIVVGFLVFQNKIDKVKADAEQTVNNARVQLVVMQSIADYRDKFKDGESLRNINVDEVSYPFNLCQREFKVGTATKAEVEKLFKGDKGPTPTITPKGEDEVEYTFNFMFRSVTIIIKYEGDNKIVKSIEYRAEE